MGTEALDIDIPDEYFDGAVKLMWYVYGVVPVKLRQVAEICRGKEAPEDRKPPGELRYDIIKNGPKPYASCNTYNCEAGTAFVIYSGSAGKVGYSEDRFYCASGCFYLKEKKEYILSKYLYYVLEDNEQYLISKSEGTGVKRLSSTALGNLSFYLPTKERQAEIVEKLDKLKALISDRESGIIAEIDARNKQYEYYRDEILDRLKEKAK